jgi:hypothetical protein
MVYAVAQLLAALHYESKLSRLHSLWGYWDFSFPAALWPRGGNGGRCVRLTTLPLLCADYLEILGASTSWSPKGLPGLYRDRFYQNLVVSTGLFI